MKSEKSETVFLGSNPTSAAIASKIKELEADLEFLEIRKDYQLGLAEMHRKAAERVQESIENKKNRVEKLRKVEEQK